MTNRIEIEVGDARASWEWVLAHEAPDAAAVAFLLDKMLVAHSADQPSTRTRLSTRPSKPATP